jgi:hypothetical protein
MTFRALQRLGFAGLAAGLIGGGAAPALAQYLPGGGTVCPPAPCPAPYYAPAPATTPGTPGAGTGMPAMGGTVTPPSAAAPGFDVASLGGQSSAALGGETAGFANPAGYIDGAVPRSQFRLRYDAGFDDNLPDRAEFFYAKCGCSGGPGVLAVPQRVDFQEVSSYLEYAPSCRFSGFIEVPVRFLDMDDRRADVEIPNGLVSHSNFAGLSDINAGFKYAFVAERDQYLTFQFRTFAPTGEAQKGLGTDHVSLEPALLAYDRLGSGFLLQAELRDWIPVGGTDFEGNVLRYGIGAGYDLGGGDHLHVVPIAELVGWTVLGGKETVVPPTGTPFVQSSDGATIVNAKVGVRTYFGERSDVYVGYGRALTGDVWYKDIVRVEYRLAF